MLQGIGSSRLSGEIQRGGVADACVVVACQVFDHARGQLDVVGAVGLQVRCGVDGDGTAADGNLCVTHSDGSGVGAVADDDVAGALGNGLRECQHDVGADGHSGCVVCGAEGCDSGRRVVDGSCC